MVRSASLTMAYIIQIKFGFEQRMDSIVAAEAACAACAANKGDFFRVDRLDRPDGGLLIYCVYEIKIDSFLQVKQE